MAILAIALFLRFWNVWNQDLFGDEAPDAFRAVGYIDYVGSSFQTQPIDWYKDTALPWWTLLSFHDFPPLGIMIMNFFFQFFSDSLLIARLPAIIAGTLSVYLLYLIVKKLFSAEGPASLKRVEAGEISSQRGGKDETLALFSALFFAVNAALVWVFRISMLEPILLFFILLNIYFFFKFLENRKFWWFFGITLGLVALTKYTGVFLVPVYIFYLLISGFLESYGFPKPIILKDRRFYAALGLALLLFTPVIIYNFYLYKATGHFDLQFAYFLGQEAPEWSGSIVGKTQAPFSEIWQNLVLRRIDQATNSVFPVGYYGIPAIIVVLAGIIYSSFIFVKNRSGGILFFWLYLFFVTLLLTKIGSAHRFLTLYGPAFAAFAGLFLVFLWNLFKGQKWNYLSKSLVLAFVVWELIHSVNTNFIQFPDYGMAKLDRYFEAEFAGKKSAVIPESDNPHLNKIIYKFAFQRAKVLDRQFWLIIYNDNVALPTLEWIFYRRFFYHNIPALYVENFIKTSNEQGLNYFEGFQIYFVQSTENTILNPFKKDKTVALEFENYLLSKKLQPEKIIYGKNQLPMFRVYKFTISDL